MKCCIFSSVATVRSTQPSYSVNEGETLEIDIQLFGQKGPGRECIVSVSTIDGTALCKYINMY